MPDRTATGGARPFRSGVVAPVTSDFPTWRDTMRRIADSGYSTMLMPVVPPSDRLTRVRATVSAPRDLDGPDLHTPVVMAVRGPKASAGTRLPRAIEAR